MEKKRTTIVLFSGDYDKAMAAYIIATEQQPMIVKSLFSIPFGVSMPFVNKSL